MIEDWDIPVQRQSAEGPLQVAAIVPLPDEMGGNDEVLVLSAFGNLKLPMGDLQPRESSLKAVTRITLGSTGVRVTPERLVYVVEQPAKPVVLCILCGLVEDDDGETKPGVKFAKLADMDGEFEPAALRDLLIEDVRSGFVRGVAHVVTIFDDNGRPQTSVTW